MNWLYEVTIRDHNNNIIAYTFDIPKDEADELVLMFSESSILKVEHVAYLMTLQVA